ncbi:hypothetical protein GIB67_003005 [Kingdonia uniflora]|uniref:Uncharacterized protein n=1 Tax=Kingdonia uniflora TaxID=39325 RepID=A0A7J7LYN5_9MAGN|nr:hypothetical protein GIB67_003005 [Kingdonia uniflora]
MDNGNRPTANSGFSTRGFYEEPNQERPTAGSGFRILHNPQQFTVDRLPGTSGFSIRNGTEVENYVRQTAYSGFSIGHDNQGQDIGDRTRADTGFTIRQGPMQETILTEGYMIKARDLIITHGNDSRYWNFRTLPMSRYGEVAELLAVWWLEVRGSIKTRELSPDTTYEAYFVYNLAKRSQRFGVTDPHLEVLIEILGIEGSEKKRSVCLDRKSEDNPPQLRRDGWMEIKMGEFLNVHGEDTEVQTTIREISSSVKAGLFIQGIEFRPKESSA